MLRLRPPNRRLTLPHATAGLSVLACGGCSMLGAMAHENPIGLVALVIAIIAAVGFLASRSQRR